MIIDWQKGKQANYSRYMGVPGMIGNWIAGATSVAPVISVVLSICRSGSIRMDVSRSAGIGIDIVRSVKAAEDQ